jgi:hypothetical protein
MKLALIAGVSGLAMIVGVTAANAQSRIDPNIYPMYRGAPVAQQPWEWHAGPGPSKRGGMCVKHIAVTATKSRARLQRRVRKSSGKVLDRANQSWIRADPRDDDLSRSIFEGIRSSSK